MSKNENLKRFASMFSGPMFSDPMFSGPMFSGSGLDRKDHWRQNNAKMAEVLAAENLRIIGFVDGRPLMDVSQELDIYYFSKASLPQGLISEAGCWHHNWVFLGVQDEGDIPFIALDMSDLTAEAMEVLRESQVKCVDLRSCAFQFDLSGVARERGALLAAGKSLLSWHKSHGYCAQCGAKTSHERAGYQRVCSESGCRAEHFPRTDPVVLMLVVHENMCLMGRSAHFVEGAFSALAGFMEPGETIEEAVQRECEEEVGLKVGQVKYIVSQPWPFPSSLMIGCTAVADSKNITIDGNELESARWFSKEEVRSALRGDEGLGFSTPPPLALAHNLLQHWLEN